MARLIGARVKNSATQSRASNSALVFDQEDYDDAGFHDTGSNTSRLTIPAGMGGRYHVGAFGKTSAGAAGNYGLYFKTGGTTDQVADFRYSNDTTDKQINLAMDITLAAGDYIEVFVNHTGSITWGTACRFWIHRIG